MKIQQSVFAARGRQGKGWVSEGSVGREGKGKKRQGEKVGMGRETGVIFEGEREGTPFPLLKCLRTQLISS